MSTRTVYRWFKTSLENAGIDVNVYKGHSLRTASVSKASLHGLNIQSMLKDGGWSRESNHYLRNIKKKDLLIDQSVQSSLF